MHSVVKVPGHTPVEVAVLLEETAFRVAKDKTKPSTSKKTLGLQVGH